MLIKPLKSFCIVNKIIQKKNLKKSHNLVKKVEKVKKVKGTKRTRKFRFKFKPTHCYLRSFIKGIKRRNLKKYKGFVKYFFRVFRLNSSLFSYKNLLKSNYSIIKVNLFKGNLLNSNKKIKNTIYFPKNRFLSKPVIAKRRILSKNIISKKIINKLERTLNISNFKSLNKFYFIKHISNKKLISYNVPYFKKKNLNKIINLKVTKRFRSKVLKRFNPKTYYTGNVNYGIITGKLSIVSKYKTPFILSNLGFIFIQNIRNNIKIKLKSKINRYKYSFFYLNDIKRFFLKKPSQFKLLTSSLFSNNFNKSKFFNIKRFNGFFENNYNSDFISKSSLLLNTSRIENFIFKGKSLYNKNLSTYSKKEVRIKRIKFKPGYSRI